MNEKKNPLSDEALNTVTGGTSMEITNNTMCCLIPEGCPKCGSLNVEYEKPDNGYICKCMDCNHTW